MDGHLPARPLIFHSPAVSSARPLPNYDTDRDGAPGLLVQKGVGLGETNPNKMQRWWEALGPLQLRGTPSLELWAAAKDFDTGQSGQIVVGIYDCAADKSGCVLLASGAASFNQATFGATFGRVVIVMPSIDATITAGRGLMLKVAPIGESADDLWLAYGATAYPTSLTIAS